MFVAEKTLLAGMLLAAGLIGAAAGPTATPAFAADLPTKKLAPAPIPEPAIPRPGLSI